MSILDDAIREHLALKRARGADEAELKRLEEEAFGPPRRPDEVDPFAEAPTEFLGEAEPGAQAPEGAGPEPEGRRLSNIADLQEPPSAAEPPPEADSPEPPAAEGPNTEERQAIAEQPTQLFDVESEIEADADAPADAPEADALEAAEPEAAAAPTEPPTEADAPETATPEADEPEAVEPAAPEDEYEDDIDDFWSDERLSDELDKALDAPITEEELLPGAAATEAAPAEGHELEQDEELEAAEDEEVGEDEVDAEADDAEPGPEGDDAEPVSYEPDTGHHDVLEDTPEFLEDAPEDDELWFEQRPPKDFDFDD